MKYFFRQLLAGSNSSSDDEHLRKILCVSQIAMLNITSIAKLKCEPPLAVFLSLKLYSYTRSKNLVELLHQNCLSLSYKRILSIEISSRSQHLTIWIIIPHLGHGTGISIFQFPSSDEPGLGKQPTEIDSWARVPGSLPPSYAFVPPVGSYLINLPPIKHVKLMSMSLLGKEEDHEKEWMMRVNSILHAEL